MISLVAFDWNGTLLADTTLTLTATNKAFSVFGLPKINLARYQETFTIPVTDFYEANGMDRKAFLKDTKHSATVFHNVYEALAIKVRTRKGAKQTLSYLALHNISPIIFSNHTEQRITEQLNRLRINQYIEGILAHTEVDGSIKGKHKDKKLADYVARKKIPARSVIVVGDTEEEIEIGKTYGYITVALTGGNHSHKRLARLNPDYIINSLPEIISIVKKLNRS